MRPIVFDWDGTLLDSRERHTVLLRDVCSELRLPISSEQLESYLPSKCCGMSTVQYLTRVCGFSSADAERCAASWVAGIETWPYLRIDRLYADTRAVLIALRDIGADLVLITARQNETLFLRQIETLELAPLFSRVFCVNPREAKWEKTRKAQAVGPLTCWVGDTEVDQFAAGQLSCPFYALNRGFRNHSYWEDKEVPSYPDLSCLSDFLIRQG